MILDFRTGFPDLYPFSSWITLCFEGSHCRVFGSIPSLYLLDARASLSCDNQDVSRCRQISHGEMKSSLDGCKLSKGSFGGMSEKEAGRQRADERSQRRQPDSYCRVT